MAWSVYIVRCADASLYTGVATDVARRIAEHNEGQKGARYTATRRPVCLVYTVDCETRSDALKEEWRIKQLSRVEKLSLIAATKKAAPRGGMQPSTEQEITADVGAPAV